MRFVYLLLCILVCCGFTKQRRKEFQEVLRSAPQWMQEEIDRRFEAMESADPDFSEKNFLEREYGVKIEILNSKILCSRADLRPHVEWRLNVALSFLKQLAHLAVLPDCQFYLCLGDGYDNSYAPLPILTFSTTKPGIIPFPDYDAVGGYAEMTRQILQANRQSSWESKIPQLFWRGTTTGAIFNEDNWDEMPRTKMVLFSLENPSLANARFTSRCQGAEHIPQMEALLGNFVSPGDSVSYKYLIDIDGNASTYPRFYWTLLANSVLFKQVTPCQQWFYNALEPYVHYIPVKEDLSDLKEQLEWAKEHDGECRRIAQASTEFALHNLQKKHTLAYVYLVIQRIAQEAANHL